MNRQPRIEQRLEQPSAVIRTRVPMERLANVAALSSEVRLYISRMGVEPAGAPFFRYLIVDMAGELELEVGWPTQRIVQGDGTIEASTLPGGRYAVTTHRGHPDHLRKATGSLLSWGREHDIGWDVSADGTRWGGRFEFYLTDPNYESNMNHWETELAFRLAD